jgi:hypothetical protein
MRLGWKFEPVGMRAWDCRELLSAAAGGESAFTRFPLGTRFHANINHTQLSSANSGLAGTLRFDAPVVVLRPEESFRPLTAPFVLSGKVTAFAADDFEARMPLFDVTLIGQGTARLIFEDFANGSYREPAATYTFADAGRAGS